MKRSLGFIFVGMVFQFIILNGHYTLWGIEHPQRVNQKENLNKPDPLLNIISIDANNIPFEEALFIISKKGKCKLNYNRNRIPVQEKITLKMSNTRVLDVLQKVLNITDTELQINKGGYFLIVPRKHRYGTLIGQIYESSNYRRIPGVQIYLINTKFFTLSDENGEFKFFNIPEGKYNLKIVSEGFHTVVKKHVVIEPTQLIPVNIELVPQLPEIREVVNIRYEDYLNLIHSHKVNHLKGEEISRTAGTVGGISRNLKVIPGITTLSDTNIDLIIRGGSSLENGFYIDNIEIPTINHLPKLGSTGGFYSALNSTLIQHVNLFNGSFSSDYGDRLSSIIDITLREGNREDIQGQIDLSMAMAGVVLEGPINQKGSWLLSIRDSQLGILHDLGCDLETVPSTFDYQIKLFYDLTPMHKIRFLNFHSKGTFKEEDRLDLPLLHNQWYSQNTAGINLVSFWDKDFFSNTSIFFTTLKRTDEEKFGINAEKRDIWRRDETGKFYGLRNTNFLNLNEKNKLVFGFKVKNASNRFGYLIYDYHDEVHQKTPTENMVNKYNRTQYSLFFTYIYQPSKLVSAEIGLRGDYSSKYSGFNLSPRFNLIYRVTKNLILNGGLGVFYQAIPANYLASIPNDDHLRDMKAFHYTLGIECFIKPGTRIYLDTYYKKYKNLPLNTESPHCLITDEIINLSTGLSSDPIDYLAPSYIETQGSGYSTGIELMIKEKLSRKFYCTLSASVYRSRYRDLLGVLRDRAYDNRYVLNLMGCYKFNPGLEFNIGWTLMGGAPYTPIDLLKSSELNRCFLDQSKFMGERYPVYSTINLRIDKQFKLKKSTLILCLDLLNLFDRDNVFYYMWKDHYVQAEDQLPFLPVLGLKYEF